MLKGIKNDEIMSDYEPSKFRRYIEYSSTPFFFPSFLLRYFSLQELRNYLAYLSLLYFGTIRQAYSTFNEDGFPELNIIY